MSRSAVEAFIFPVLQSQFDSSLYFFIRNIQTVFIFKDRMTVWN